MKQAKRSERGWVRYGWWTAPLLVGIGFAVGQWSNSGYGNAWFDALVKPAFMPPGWLFGVAWTLLYLLLGVTLAMALAARPGPARSRALALFAAQMALNFAWSPLFFAAHDMKLALVVLLAMIALTVAAIHQFRQFRPLAGGLMLPYLGWLSFATALNAATLRLNPGANVSLLGL